MPGLPYTSWNDLVWLCWALKTVLSPSSSPAVPYTLTMHRAAATSISHEAGSHRLARLRAQACPVCHQLVHLN